MSPELDRMEASAKSSDDAGENGQRSSDLHLLSTADIYRRLADLGVTPEQARDGIRRVSL